MRQTDGQTQDAVGTRRKTRPMTDRQSGLWLCLKTDRWTNTGCCRCQKKNKATDRQTKRSTDGRTDYLRGAMMHQGCFKEMKKILAAAVGVNLIGWRPQAPDDQTVVAPLTAGAGN